MVAVKVIKTDLLKNLEVAINTLNTKVAKVGWFEGAKYNDDKKTQVAEVATIHEFGAPSKNIPARPFMRPTINNKKNEWQNIALKKSKLIIEGKLKTEDLFELIGQKAAFDISKKIENVWSPPLSPTTIKARMNKYTSDPVLAPSTKKKRKREVQKFVSTGFYKPLEDSGHMLATLINVVENE